MKAFFYWHVHHDILYEFLTEPLYKRISYIQTDKPAEERATRLKWLTPVRGEIPTPLVEIAEKYLDDLYNYNSTTLSKNLSNNRASYSNAVTLCYPVMEKLHRKEHPDCPWDGLTIFPSGKSA